MLRILHDTKYDFIKFWKTAVIGTIAFIALGVVLLGVHAARSARTSAERKFAQNAPPDVVRAAVDQAGFSGSEVTSFGDASTYLVKAPPKEGDSAAQDAAAVGQRIADVLKQRLPNNPVRVDKSCLLYTSDAADERSS